MPLLANPPSVHRVHVHAPRGISYLVFAVLAVAHALVGQWVFSTVGEPYRQTLMQNERIQATTSLIEGAETRNLLMLQSGLTRAAELPTFNETLFDDAKSLHQQLRKRLDTLKEAVSAGEAGPLADALETAIELHGDGRPIVDRHHLRAAAKRLQEVEKKAKGKDGGSSELEPLYARIKAAIELSRDTEETGDSRLEEEEKKLPSQYLPSFWACLALFGCLLALVLTHMSCHWSVAFKALMYYHPTSSLEVGSFVRVVPLPHRGTAEIVPLQRSSAGRLFFLHQRQKFEVLAAGDEDPASDEAVPSEFGIGGRVHRCVGLCRPILCPIERPLAEYVASSGLSIKQVASQEEEFGKNSFEIPMPT